MDWRSLFLGGGDTTPPEPESESVEEASVCEQQFVWVVPKKPKRSRRMVFKQAKTSHQVRTPFWKWRGCRKWVDAETRRRTTKIDDNVPTGSKHTRTRTLFNQMPTRKGLQSKWMLIVSWLRTILCPHKLERPKKTLPFLKEGTQTLIKF